MLHSQRGVRGPSCFSDCRVTCRKAVALRPGRGRWGRVFLERSRRDMSLARQRGLPAIRNGTLLPARARVLCLPSKTVPLTSTLYQYYYYLSRAVVVGVLSIRVRSA